MKLSVFVGGGYEVTEQWVRLQWFGFELGMELAPEKEWVRGNLHDLDVGGIRRRACQTQPPTGEDGFIFPVELVAVPVPFADLVGAIGLCGEGVRIQRTGPGA